MNIKTLIYMSCILMLGLLQSVVLDEFKIFGVKPNLFIVFIISISIIRRKPEPVIIGVIIGLVQDVISGKVLGLYALLGMYLAIAVSYYNKRIYKEGLFVVMIFTLIGTLIYELSVFFMIVFWGSNTSFLYALRYIILPEALLNTLCSIFIHLAVIRLSKWMDESSGITRKY